MPNIGALHPYVVHIVIGFLVAGVVFRLVSVTGKMQWSNQAAAALLIVGALASVVAVRSGDDAHGPAERVPGARAAVIEHEDWGKRARNLFLIIGAVELAGLAFSSRPRAFRLASAALGAVGLFVIYETGEHGGELVYSYAGGVGLRTGEPDDVRRLLLAGLYHQAMQDRRDGKGEAAGTLLAEMARRWPDDPEVRVLAVDSRLRDLHDAPGAVAAADSVLPSLTDPRLQRNLTLIKVYALLGADQRDSARAVLSRLAEANPASARYRSLLDSIR
jgi:uncharacterized membrane protein